MDCNTLAAFRRGVYGCFRRAGDALMNLVDALSCETPAKSLAELSFSPFFTRQWPSVYEALQDAKIDRDALAQLFAANAPVPAPGQRLVLGGDASSILRVESASARDRTYVHASNLPEDAKPVRPGWQFSTLSVLPETPSSWTYVLDNTRIPSDRTQASVMAEQLERLLPHLPSHPLWIGDGYYGSHTFLSLVADLPCDILARFANNRVLYRQPPPVEGKAGAGHPRWHGAPFDCKDPRTHGPPDAAWEGLSAHGHPLQVACWKGLHFKKARHIPLSVVRVTRPKAEGTKRDPRVSWFVFEGTHLPELSAIPGLYALRYSLEHAYRVDKGDLLWETPRLRTPEQLERWTDLVACVRNQLYLARDLAGAQRQAWESKSRDSTPQQVRRAMGRIIVTLGTPARVCQPRGYSSGWPAGRSRQPVPTYKVVFKGAEEANKVTKPRALEAKAVPMPP